MKDIAMYSHVQQTIINCYSSLLNNKGREITAMINSVLWNREITGENKLLIYNSIVKSTVTYGAETWKFNKNLESKLMSMEMDFLRRSTRCSRLEKNQKQCYQRKNEY